MRGVVLVNEGHGVLFPSNDDLDGPAGKALDDVIEWLGGFGRDDEDEGSSVERYMEALSEEKERIFDRATY